MGTTAIIAMNNIDAHRAMVIAHRTNDACFNQIPQE